MKRIIAVGLDRDVRRDRRMGAKQRDAYTAAWMPVSRMSAMRVAARSGWQEQGNMQPDRWGLKGVEDLGGGLNAVFQLENGFYYEHRRDG